MLERLQKIIARAGVASRREAEVLITDGKVTVNGELVTELGAKADPTEDHIKVKGKLIQVDEERKYILLYKPKGFVSTVHDPEGRPTVTDLIQESQTRMYPVGRLDFNTEGVLLLTNDGDLTHQLLAPKSKCPKTYTVKVSGQPDPKTIMRLQRGITVDGNRYSSCQIETLKSGQNSWMRVVLFEGKNHQIKKMFESVGHPVSKLRRIAFAFLTTKGLRPGEWRYLSQIEVDRLQRGDYDFLTPLNPFKYLREVGVGLRLSDYEAYRKAHGGPPPTRSKAPGRPRFGSKRPGQQRSGPRRNQRDGEGYDSRDSRDSRRSNRKYEGDKRSYGGGSQDRDRSRDDRNRDNRSRDDRNRDDRNRDDRNRDDRRGSRPRGENQGSQYRSRDNRRDEGYEGRGQRDRDSGQRRSDSRRDEGRGGHGPRDRGYGQRRPDNRRDEGYRGRDDRDRGPHRSGGRRDEGPRDRDRGPHRSGGRRDEGPRDRDRGPHRSGGRRDEGPRDRDRGPHRSGGRRDEGPRDRDRGPHRSGGRRDEGYEGRGPRDRDQRDRDRGPRRDGDYRRGGSGKRGDSDSGGDSNRGQFSRGRSDENRGGSNRGKPARFKAKRPQKAWSKSFDRSKKDSSKKS